VSNQALIALWIVELLSQLEVDNIHVEF